MDISISEMWRATGWFGKGLTVFMAALSVWSVYAMIDRLLVYAKGASQSFTYVRALEEYLAKGSFDEALAAAKRHPASPIARVVTSGLEAYQEGRVTLKEQGLETAEEFDLVDSVHRSLERVQERETANLRKRVGGLATIASISPFVGLLGTVVGIIGAFDKLKGGGGMDVVGPSIAEALLFTAYGLVVAIPAAMMFNYFTGRIENIVVDMNDVSSEFIDYVLKRGRV